MSLILTVFGTGSSLLLDLIKATSVLPSHRDLKREMNDSYLIRHSGQDNLNVKCNSYNYNCAFVPVSDS